jgi:hypothetical protein
MGLPVLDPNYKNAYAENNWDIEYYEAGMDRLRAVVRLINPSMISSSLMIIFVTV